MHAVRSHKVWLSREATGYYMCTKHRPDMYKIGNTDKFEYYINPGDPIGIRHWCSEGIKAFFDIDIPIGEQIQITMTIHTEIHEEE